MDEKTGKATQLLWKKDSTKNASEEAVFNLYPIRNSLPFIEDVVVIWNIYSTIRQIESTFRNLKTDLDLRSIYHKNNKATMGHLHPGLLAYWLVNTTRYQLKGHGINYGCKEIGIGNTQKLVTTLGTNPCGQSIKTIKCTQPAEKLKQLTEILGLPPNIKRKKSVVHKMVSQKNETQQQRRLLSG